MSQSIVVRSALVSSVAWLTQMLQDEVITETRDFQIDWEKIIRPEPQARFSGGSAQVFLGKIKSSDVRHVC